MAGQASNNSRKPHFTCISNIINGTRDRCHRTPEFTIESMENTTWYVCLTYGDNHRPTVGCIERMNDDGPTSIQIEFELKYFDSGRSTMLKGSGIFGKNDCSREFEFPEMVEARYETCSKGYETLKCCIWRKGTEISKSELCFASTHHNIYHQLHVWAVKQFSLVLQGEKRTKALNGITKECPQMNLIISSADWFGKECLILYLEVPHLKALYAVQAETSLLDLDGNVIFCIHESMYLNPALPIIKLAIFEKGYFECRELLFDDVLLMRCRLKFTTANPVWSGITDYSITDSKALLKEESTTDFREPGVCPFKDILNKFMEDGTLSDVCLRAGGESFPAHKFILSSRSSVFKVMFYSDMKQKTSKSIDIPDLDAETLKRVLLYIYKDEVEELTLETAGNLLKAADKYELMDLKEKCYSFFRSILRESNVCEILVLADMYRDESLLKLVQEFLMEYSFIICSDVWDVFEQNHTKLALETSEQIFNLKMKRKGYKI